MRKALPLWLLGFCAAVLPLSCSNDEDEKGDGGDGDLHVGTGGTGDGDGDGDEGSGGTSAAEPCTTFAGLGACGTDGLIATRNQVNILLVLDKSGSMGDPIEDASGTLWDATKKALDTALTDVSSEVAFGLALYPGNVPKECGTQCCDMPEGITVPIAQDSATRDTIKQRLRLTNPGGGTPTAQALAQAYEYFDDGEGKDLKGGRYVLLATDGGPNCNGDASCEVDECPINIDAEDDRCEPGGDLNCCASRPTACLDHRNVLTEIDKLRSIGVDTFVVGLAGTEKYAEQLDEFAVEGGRPRQGRGDKYYRVDAEGSAEGLTDVLEEITKNLVQSCEIQLLEEPPDVLEVNVAVECEIIPNRGGGSGGGGEGGSDDGAKSYWELDVNTSPPTAVLAGPICEKIENEGVDRVDILLGCPIVR